MEINFNYTVYSKETGKYIKNLEMPSKADALLNTARDEVLIEGYFGENTRYDNGTIKEVAVVKPSEKFINKSDLVTQAALDGLMPLSSVGSIMRGDFPSFFDITALSDKENIEYRIWWAQIDKLFFDDPKFEYLRGNSNGFLDKLVN